MNYNIKIDLTKLFGAKLVTDPAAGEGIFIPAGGPVEIDGERCCLSLTAFELKFEYEGQTHLLKPWLSKTQAFGMTRQQLEAIPYVGHIRPWDRSSQTPGPGCKTCRWSNDAQYASGARFVRCNHPNADWRSTRDTRHIDACPDKNNQNK
jgi:hypothetical protein